MVGTSRVRVLLVACCLQYARALPQDRDDGTTSGYRDDWVDPHDMINFGSSAERMQDKLHEETATPKDKPPAQQPCDSSSLVAELKSKLDKCHAKVALTETPAHVDNPSAQQTCNPNSLVAELKWNLNVCHDKLTVFRAQAEKLAHVPVPNVDPEQSTMEVEFFKQFLRYFLKLFPSRFNRESTFDMKVRLLPSDVASLRAYTETPGGNIQDVNSVLMSIISDIRHSDESAYPWNVEDYLPLPLNVIIQITAAIACLTVSLYATMNIRLAWTTILYKLLVLSVFVSVPWNWVHLYKQAVAKKQSEAMLSSPQDCQPPGSSWQSILYQSTVAMFSFTDDKCAKYHETFLVDPLWEVSPTQAIAVTLTKFFLAPAEHLGRAISEFVKGLLKDMPIHLQPIILVTVVLLVFFVLILTCGYRVNVLHLVGIERDRNPGSERKLREQIMYLEGCLRSNTALPSTDSSGQQIENRREECDLAVCASTGETVSKSRVEKPVGKHKGNKDSVGLYTPVIVDVQPESVVGKIGVEGGAEQSQGRGGPLATSGVEDRVSQGRSDPIVTLGGEGRSDPIVTSGGEGWSGPIVTSGGVGRSEPIVTTRGEGRSGPIVTAGGEGRISEPDFHPGILETPPVKPDDKSDSRTTTPDSDTDSFIILPDSDATPPLDEMD